jgi:hypothetical protein
MALAGCGRTTARLQDSGSTTDGAHDAPSAVDAGARDVASGLTDASSETAATQDAGPEAHDASADAANDGGSEDGGQLVDAGPHPYRVLSLAVGLTHTCVILDDHRVKCWGDGASGQLGYGDTRLRGSPSDMGDALPTVDLGTGRTARAISAGRYNSCALLDDGSPKCWGIGGISGNPAQLGDQPGEMGDALPALPVPAGRTVTRVASGVSWASAILDDGSAVTWRGGMMATFPPANAPVKQIGHGSEGTGTIVLFEDGQDGALDPTRGLVETFPFGQAATGEPSIFVAGARGGQCDVLASGRAVCSSNTGGGEWSAGTVATRVAAGLEFSCLLTKDGVVRCRGSGIGGCEPAFPQNTYWCAGQPAADGSFEVLLGQPAVDVQAGDFFACALLVDGSVKCWGGTDTCVPYMRNGTSGEDCLAPATPPLELGGGVALVTVAGQTMYGPWRAVDLGKSP